jgi:hypothetical protein
MGKFRKTFIVAGLAFAGISVLAIAAEKTATKPTGSCTITVYGISPTCTAPLTQDSCNAAAKKVGGIASWTEGGSCPK